jgi:hypothetical protein
LSLCKELTNFGLLGRRGRRFRRIGLPHRAWQAGVGDRQEGKHQPNPDRYAYGKT